MGGETIAELNKIYWGAQDEAQQKHNGRRLLYNSVIETKQIKLWGNVTYNVRLPNNTSGISNVKIEGDWETIELEVGGQKFDKLYKIAGENTFDIFNHSSCLPLLEYHSIKFQITGGNNYTLQYDIVNVDSDGGFIANEIFLKQQQYTGAEDLAIGNNNIKLYFHHPVEKITVFTDYKVENLELFIDSKYKLPLTQIDDLKWELNFGDTPLNFSRMKHVRLLCNNTYENNHINTFATCHHIVRICGGMAGLRFSK